MVTFDSTAAAQRLQALPGYTPVTFLGSEGKGISGISGKKQVVF